LGDRDGTRDRRRGGEVGEIIRAAEVIEQLKATDPSEEVLVALYTTVHNGFARGRHVETCPVRAFEAW
jgi:hypothetical protein